MKAMLPMWTVYEHPKDYPDAYVARLFEVDADGPRATGSVIIMKNLDDLRDVLAFQLHLTCLARNDVDDPVIVETWL
jgi:hypothetical protein